LWEFRDSHLGQNDIWVLVPWPSTKYTIRGKVVATPKSRPWWVLWICVCPWLVYAPKCYNYAWTNLLFCLCKFMWVSEVLVNLANPIPELQHALLPQSVMSQGTHPNSFSFRCPHFWAHSWVHQGAWGCISEHMSLNIFLEVRSTQYNYQQNWSI
jgi:hypothetical protein